MPKTHRYSVNQYADILSEQVHKGYLVQTVKEILALPKVEAIAVMGHLFLRLDDNLQEQFTLTAELLLPTTSGEILIHVRT